MKRLQKLVVTRLCEISLNVLIRRLSTEKTKTAKNYFKYTVITKPV